MNESNQFLVKSIILIILSLSFSLNFLSAEAARPLFHEGVHWIFEIFNREQFFLDPK